MLLALIFNGYYTTFGFSFGNMKIESIDIPNIRKVLEEIETYSALYKAPRTDNFLNQYKSILFKMVDQSSNQPPTFTL